MLHSFVHQAIEDGARVCVDINWRPVFWPKDGEELARQEILAYAQQVHIPVIPEFLVVCPHSNSLLLLLLLLLFRRPLPHLLSPRVFFFFSFSFQRLLTLRISFHPLQADVVKLTDEESEWLFGINAADAFANPELIREHFPKAIGILVTAGKKGAAYWLLGQIGRVPVFDVKVTETTGGQFLLAFVVVSRHSVGAMRGWRTTFDP